MQRTSDDKPIQLNQRTVISFGLFVTLAAGVFLSGATWEKVSRLDSIKIEERLAKIETLLSIKNIGTSAFTASAAEQK